MQIMAIERGRVRADGHPFMIVMYDVCEYNPEVLPKDQRILSYGQRVPVLVDASEKEIRDRIIADSIMWRFYNDPEIADVMKIELHPTMIAMEESEPLDPASYLNQQPEISVRPELPPFAILIDDLLEPINANEIVSRWALLEIFTEIAQIKTKAQLALSHLLNPSG